jgi:hypothetical protein
LYQIGNYLLRWVSYLWLNSLISTPLLATILNTWHIYSVLAKRFEAKIFVLTDSLWFFTALIRNIVPILLGIVWTQNVRYTICHKLLNPIKTAEDSCFIHWLPRTCKWLGKDLESDLYIRVYFFYFITY